MPRRLVPWQAAQVVSKTILPRVGGAVGSSGGSPFSKNLYGPAHVIGSPRKAVRCRAVNASARSTPRRRNAEIECFARPREKGAKNSGYRRC